MKKRNFNQGKVFDWNDPTTYTPEQLDAAYEAAIANEAAEAK